MNRPTAFVLPEHLRITVGGASLNIRHDGDVVLEQTLGRPLGRLEATGDVTLRKARFTGSVRAGGALRIESDVDAEDLRGDVVELVGPIHVHARAIVATQRVVVGDAVLSVDVIIAPEVHITEGASGRVRVVDCRNELPSSRVRGCLSLDDYEADFGNVAEFLARRDAAPISALPAPRVDTLEETDQLKAIAPEATPFGAEPPHMAEPSYEPATVDVEPTSAEVEAEPAAVQAEAVAVEEAPTVDAEPEHDAIEEDSWEEDDATDQVPAMRYLAPEAEITELDPDATWATPLHADGVPHPESEPATARPARPSRAVRQVEKAWQRLELAYASDRPAAISAIEMLLQEGRAEEVIAQADDLWLALLRTHLEWRTPPPRTVTLAFHGIRAAGDAAE